MSLFDTYESEFKASIKTIKNKIAQFNTSKSTELGPQIESELEIARDTLENMNLVVVSTYGGETLSNRVKSYKAELENLSESWGRTRLGAAEGDNRWAKGNQALSRAGKNIQEAKRLGEESEEIGMYALGRLREDRVKLEGALDEMDEMDDNVTKARSVLSNISRKVIYSKLILAFIVFVEAVGIIVIIFVRWIKPLIDSIPPSPAPPGNSTLTPH